MIEVLLLAVFMIAIWAIADRMLVSAQRRAEADLQPDDNGRRRSIAHQIKGIDHS